MKADDFTVAWICALPHELAASQAMLDHVYDDVADVQDARDENAYTFGVVGSHNVVMACLPAGKYGNESAAIVAENFRRTFPRVDCCLLVGIGGGTPDELHDIRLGDVVVSHPTDTHGGVIHYDMGKLLPHGVYRRRGHLNQPPRRLLSAVSTLRAAHEVSASKLSSLLCEALERNPSLHPAYSKPSHLHDQLYSGDGLDAVIIDRPLRTNPWPSIHYGLIASGNKVVASKFDQHRLKNDAGDILCFEMEAAGLLNVLPSLVVRGICDYADARKNDGWQRYAALTAAAYAKEVVQVTPACALPAYRQAKESTELRREEQETILDWISSIPYHSHYVEARKAILKGTGQWLFQLAEFIHWHTSSSSGLLLLHGIPGSGKTMLLTTVLRFLEENHVKSRDAFPIFFYCSRNNAETNRSDPEQAILSLARQIADIPGGPLLNPVVTKRYSQRRSMGNIDIDEATSLIVQMVQDRPVTYLLIDALDELRQESRPTLLSSLQRILNEASTPVKIFVTSRHEGDINKIMQQHPNIQTDVSKNQDDIERYTSHRMDDCLRHRTLLRRHTVSSELRSEIEQTLCKGAQGMFRWVELQIQHLCSFSLPSHVKKELGKLPPTLRESYQQLYDKKMKSVPELEALLIKKILTWLLIGQRQLTTQELIHFTCEKDLDTPNVAIVDLCFNLIVLDAEQNCFRLSHPSVREFLESLSDFGYPEMHGTACADCLRVILDPVPPKKDHYASVFWIFHAEGARDDACVQQLDQLFLGHQRFLRGWITEVQKRLLALALTPWKRTACEDRLADVFEFPIGSLVLAASFGLVSQIESLCNNQPTSTVPWRKHLGVAVCGASYYGHDNCVNKLIELHADLDVVVGKYGSSLQAALQTGQVGVVRALLKAGANINTTGGESGTPLQAAAAGGSIELVKILLDNGARVNELGGELDTALKAAAFHGHEGIAKLLIAHGADVNAQCDGTALAEAAYGGYESIVQMLVEAGADPKCESDETGKGAMKRACERGDQRVVALLLRHGFVPHGFDLQHASRTGNADIVRMLLQHNVNINDLRSDDGSAIQVASLMGHIDIVEILIEHGANVESMGGRKGSAVQLAARGGHRKVVDKLIACGAQVNYSEGEWDTALQAASYGGFKEIVELLLDLGAAINTESGLHGTAVQAAAYKGRLDVVELLLQKDAHIGTTDYGLGSPLHAASLEGHHAIVEKLLEHGADVHAEGGGFGTALIAASYRGHESIVHRLLDHGAQPDTVSGRHSTGLQAMSRGRAEEEFYDVVLGLDNDFSCQTGFHGTALHAAAFRGHESIMRVLIERGADPQAQGGEYHSTLQAACVNGSQEIIALLLRHQVNVNSKGGDYGCPLIAASFWGHRKVVELLLQAGAHVNTEAGLYGSPLQAAAFRAHADVVRLLLDRSANVDARAGDYGSALQAASNGGYESIVSMLLDSKANIHAPGSLVGTAVQAASCSGHFSIVDLLLRCGADASAASAKFFNTLGAALQASHSAVVELLVDRRANTQGAIDSFRDSVSHTLSTEDNDMLWSLMAHPKVSILRELKERQQHQDDTGYLLLAEYQEQLMLLEQENKQRLLIARQEQERRRQDDTGNLLLAEYQKQLMLSIQQNKQRLLMARQEQELMHLKSEQRQEDPA